ncbi:MAG TPA: beta-propeller fold lactonase family protein [Candidatus Caenarcaniphilales bacterium]|nr:beta-propeller fold lactonase family protein [Candidatus Caenarcaniphilales bacterium]
MSRLLVAVVTLLALYATPGAPPARAGSGDGLVFTMSNSASANRVLAWSRAADGSLTFVGRTATGGRGTGAPLNNQGALALSDNGRWLYVVNPGSDSVSAFRVEGTSLTLVDVEPSRGDRPVSVTTYGRLVYVLNAGGQGNIRGFRRGTGGRISSITGSGRPLSGSAVVPAQVGFSVNGTELIVTERATDRLSRYHVTSAGTPEGPFTRASAGAEPFGFDFSPDGTLVVSEAGDHVEDGSSTSSYRFKSDGGLRVVSGAVPTTETAACWTVVTPDGRFAYVTNTPDHSITGYALGTDGSLTVLDGNGRTAATGGGSFPIDVDASADSRFLYALAAGTDRILVYEIGGDGSLTARPGVSGLPGAANGLVAR